MTPEMRCDHEETFGPVVTLTPVKNADEAVRLANDTSYGLAAAIITGDPKRGMALAERIQSGIVHVNDSTVHDEPHAPFGGIKSSGLGRHGGRAAIEAFTVFAARLAGVVEETNAKRATAVACATLP